MTLALTVGRTYRGKKPGRIAGHPPLVNDRTIKWIGTSEVQYDGPSVANGRQFPRVSIEKFRKWADRDVTDELPAGEYATWPPARQLVTYAAGPTDLSASIDGGIPDVERAPGYYWALMEDGKREPVEWTGKSWWGIAMTRAYSEDEIRDPVLITPPSP